jgi:hypothetical protein
MKVELVPPDSDTAPRHWVRHDQAFAMMLGPGSIEWGSKRSALEKFAYAAGRFSIVRPSSGRVGRTDECAASATRHVRCGTDGCI